MERPAGAEDRNQMCEEQKSAERQRDEQQLEKEKDRKEHLNQELNVLEEKAKRLRDGRMTRKFTCRARIYCQTWNMTESTVIWMKFCKKINK